MVVDLVAVIDFRHLLGAAGVVAPVGEAGRNLARKPIDCAARPAKPRPSLHASGIAGQFAADGERAVESRRGRGMPWP